MKKTILALAALLIASWLYFSPKDKGIEQLVLSVDLATERYTTAGPVVGGADGENTYAWLGIPYAAAPIGELRWRAPHLPDPWQEPRTATTFGNPCIQLWGPLGGLEGEPGDVIGAEDCLFLNIWSPQTNADADAELLPVMFWIHGGGNTIGTANTYPGKYLAGRQKVILVTINYRLGILGWLRHPAFGNAAANAREASGNFAILDMIIALEWVQNNIANFGGNPDNVTIFGESAGGRDVYALMASPIAGGLFHRVIAQSGSLSTESLARAENYLDDSNPGVKLSSRELFNKQLIASGQANNRATAKVTQDSMSDEQTRAFLRGRSPQQLLSGLSGGAGMYRTPQNFGDGHVLPQDSLLDVFSDPARYNSVPLMTGTTRDELKLFLAQDPEMVERRFGFLPRIRDTDNYNRTAAYFSDRWKALSVDEPAARISASNGAPVFAYRWDWDEGGKNWLVDYSSLIGAGHGMEVPFVFNDFDGEGWIPGFFNDDNIPGRDLLSAQMMSYWSEFAYSGQPGSGRDRDLPQWKAWDSGPQNLMLLDSPAGGGPRMSNQQMTVAQLKQRLRTDPGIVDKLARCQTYVGLFRLTDFWSQREYVDLGCGEYDPQIISPER
ncbi:MAG: carboxylesterase family protein [Halieaceae bacterium]|nr:carboxylesterase family protein [Halieaceae bacterium]